jgi:hypothetical protein
VGQFEMLRLERAAHLVHDGKAEMPTSAKIVGGCATVGFLLPLAMLAYNALSGTIPGKGLTRVCPSCMMTMALDHASTTTGIIVWLIICVSNAILYALPGAGVAFLVSLRKAN